MDMVEKYGVVGISVVCRPTPPTCMRSATGMKAWASGVE
jgi:hypothetical protein